MINPVENKEVRTPKMVTIEESFFNELVKAAKGSPNLSKGLKAYLYDYKESLPKPFTKKEAKK